MRSYVIDAVKNRYDTHWIMSIADTWDAGYSWDAGSRTIHLYKGSQDGEKVEINSPSFIKGEFLHLLLTSAFIGGVRVVVIPIDRINDMSLKFQVFEDIKAGVSK